MNNCIYSLRIAVRLPDLEYVGEISQVEHVVKLDGGRQEHLRDLLLHVQRSRH